MPSHSPVPVYAGAGMEFFMPVFSFSARHAALCVACLAATLFLPCRATAFSAAADNVGGYSSQVLNQILRVWHQPAGARGTALAELTIEPSGALSGCNVLQPSLSPAADAALCAAAQNAAPYPYPPFGAQTRVSLAMAYGPDGAAGQNTTAPAPSYADSLRDAVTPHLILPQGLSGSWTTVVELLVQADGSLKSSRISHSSGNAEADAAVMAAVLSPGAFPPPPGHTEQRVSLSFTLSAR